MIPRSWSLAIVAAVTAVWVGNWLLLAVARITGWFVWEPDVALHGIFMVVVGGALVVSRRRATDPHDTEPDLPDGVPPPPGYDAMRRTVADLLDPARRDPPGGASP